MYHVVSLQTSDRTIVSIFVSIVGGGDDEDEESEDRRCDMHLALLALGLALSLVKSTQDKKVINFWPGFQDLYKALKTAMKYIFDKKNKRFDQYSGALKKRGQNVIIVPLPNKTRVGGAGILIQAALRSIHALLYYASRCEPFRKLCPKRGQWRQIAEFEAVMRPALSLCFDS